MKFNITCSQKLDDGDTALVEEYRNVEACDVADIMNTYYQRSSLKSYVEKFTVVVDIVR